MNLRNINKTVVRNLVFAGVTLVACLAVTASLWHYSKNQAMQSARIRFDFRAREMKFAVQQRMMAYEQVLRGGVGLFAASRSVERDEWRTYVRTLKLEQNYPGIQGVGFSKRILPEEKEAHIREIRSEGFPNYTIRPEGERAEYTSIIYLEPFNWRNQRAFGYDMLSEPVRHAAMERGRDTGMTAVSGKVILVQETDQGVQSGFLMYLPVYRNGAAIDTVDQRRAALVGYVYSPFRVNDLMRGIMGTAKSSINMEIFDGTEISEKASLYDDNLANSTPNAQKPGLFSSTETIDVNGRPWTLRFSSLPVFEATIDRQKPLIVLVAGIAMSFLISAVVWSLAATRQLNAELERRVELRTAELQAANQELESFSYSVSHDLRAPLRAVNGFAQILLEEHATQLSPDARRYLELVTKGGKQMGQLVDDLLAFSRLGRAALQQRAVAHDSIIRECLEVLASEQKNRQVEIKTAALPASQGDPALLKQVWMNLLSNALKFTRRQETAVIEIGSAGNNGQIVFFVKDNGVGFDMKYSDKLFGIFQRLHKPDEFEGTGVGLAIVKRVIERHGGRVWAEAQPDKGATFYFTLNGGNQHA